MPLVTFDFCHAPPTLSQAQPNPSSSVNELEVPGAIAGSWFGWRIACLHVRVGDCVEAVLLTHTGSASVWWSAVVECCCDAMFVDSVTFSLRMGWCSGPTCLA